MAQAWGRGNHAVRGYVWTAIGPTPGCGAFRADFWYAFDCTVHHL